MQTLTVRSIKTQTHPQTKALFWYLFVGSRGGPARVKIISRLRDIPSNTHQLSQDLGLEYKGIQHHLRILEKNNIITKFGGNYGATYTVSIFFEESESMFNEIVERLQKESDDEWSR